MFLYTTTTIINLLISRCSRQYLIIWFRSPVSICLTEFKVIGMAYFKASWYQCYIYSGVKEVLDNTLEPLGEKFLYVYIAKCIYITFLLLHLYCIVRRSYRTYMIAGETCYNKFKRVCGRLYLVFLLDSYLEQMTKDLNSIR